MARTLAANVSTNVTGTYKNVQALTSPTETLQFNLSQNYTNGTAAQQATLAWSDTRTLTAAPENIDLSNSANAIKDGFGTPLLLTKFRELIIKNNSTTPGQVLTVSGTALNGVLGGTSPTVKIGPGGVHRFSSPIDGYTVTAGTGDTLTLDPGANTFSYSIILLGVE
jgi:hypothetical protein